MNEILQDINNSNDSIEADFSEDAVTPDSVLKNSRTKSRHIVCEENAKKKELAKKVLVSKRLVKSERELAYTFICGEKPPVVRRGRKTRKGVEVNLDTKSPDMNSTEMQIIFSDKTNRIELAKKVLVGKRLVKSERELAYTLLCGEKPPVARRGPKIKVHDYVCLAMDFLDMKSSGMRTNSIDNIDVLLDKYRLTNTKKNIKLLRNYLERISRSGCEPKANYLSLDESNNEYALQSDTQTNLQICKQLLKQEEILKLRGIKSYLGEEYNLLGLEDVSGKNFYLALEKGINLLIDGYDKNKNNTELGGFSKIMYNYGRRAEEFKRKNKGKSVRNPSSS